MTGKAYANKLKKEDRPKGDFYSTPKSLVWVAEDIIKKEFNAENEAWILEPCSGIGAISEEISKYIFRVRTNDLFNIRGFYNFDYIKQTEELSAFNYIITNPPFSLWDKFVMKAKTHCKKFMFIGRLNYFGTDSRLKNGIWNNLKAVYPFNRYIDYQTPYREDGLFHVGCMATAWFLWDMEYTGDPIIKVLDVQEYAKLGNFKKKKGVKNERKNRKEIPENA